MLCAKWFVNHLNIIQINYFTNLLRVYINLSCDCIIINPRHIIEIKNLNCITKKKKGLPDHILNHLRQRCRKKPKLTIIIKDGYKEAILK